MPSFGEHVKKIREQRYRTESSFSLRRVAGRIGVEPSYLSKIERNVLGPPSEATTVRLARELGENPDVLLAMAGKVSKELQGIIRKHPEAFAELIRALEEASEHAILRVVREVRDGDW